MKFDANTDFELIQDHKLKDVPTTLLEKSYVIASVILFAPSLADGGMGHYAAAVRLNDKWEVYDDYKNEPYIMSDKDSVVIHSLFYIKR